MKGRGVSWGYNAYHISHSWYTRMWPDISPFRLGPTAHRYTYANLANGFYQTWKIQRLHMQASAAAPFWTQSAQQALDPCMSRPNMIMTRHMDTSYPSFGGPLLPYSKVRRGFYSRSFTEQCSLARSSSSLFITYS